MLPRPAEEEGPGLAGWGEIELASEFWTEDKRLKGLVSASLSAQSEDSKVGGCVLKTGCYPPCLANTGVPLFRRLVGPNAL